MLHLAQVQKQELSGKLVLRLLAFQEAEYSWKIIVEKNTIPPAEVVLYGGYTNALSEGLLVLVELSPTGEIDNVQNATSWVLDLVKNFSYHWGYTRIFATGKPNAQNSGGKP
jgi:hypothetical protein